MRIGARCRRMRTLASTEIGKGRKGSSVFGKLAPARDAARLCSFLPQVEAAASHLSKAGKAAAPPSYGKPCGRSLRMALMLLRSICTLCASVAPCVAAIVTNCCSAELPTEIGTTHVHVTLQGTISHISVLYSAQPNRRYGVPLDLISSQCVSLCSSHAGDGLSKLGVYYHFPCEAAKAFFFV